MEGTSSYGAGLARHLRSAGIAVFEVERPKRRHLRRRRGKSDSRDAEAAARAVLAGDIARACPRAAVTRARGDDPRLEGRETLGGEGQDSGRKPAPGHSGDGAGGAAPASAWSLDEGELVAVAARFRPGGDPGDVEEATKLALRSVARRYQALSVEVSKLDAQLDRLVAEAAPQLVSLPAIGTDHAATLLIVVGDNPERLGTVRPPPSRASGACRP